MTKSAAVQFENCKLKRPDWLEEFEALNGRPLRVLHIGNIANNAFINAKIMRKIGIHADVVCYNYYHIMGAPEWEEAVDIEAFGDPFFPDWWLVTGDYVRPKWYFQGPTKHCQNAIVAQFEFPESYENIHMKMRLMAHFISFKNSSKWQPPTFSGTIANTKRLSRFLRFMAAQAYSRPAFAIEMANEFTKMIVISIILRLRKNAIRIKIFLQNFIRKIVRMFILKPSKMFIQILSKMFRCLFRKNFSEVFGATAIEIFRSFLSDKYRITKKSRNQNHDIHSGNTLKDFDTPQSRTKNREQSGMDLSVLGDVDWKQQHKSWHTKTPVEVLQSDIALAEALSNGWGGVLQHYDVIQCYSVDGILPMALGLDHYYNYEHGTIRAIPFDGTPIGRLTATAYRHGHRSFITNIDNLESCHRLEMQPEKIVALPHALDDNKIHSFAAKHINLKRLSGDIPEFFSSARQHWLDTDPNFAKGNDIFFRALAKVVDEGFEAKVRLVEWGRDIDATKSLLEELNLSSIVSWVPTMTGEELWERYLRSHVIVDQFILPAFGRVTFDALTLGRRVITNIDFETTREFFGEVPPILAADSVSGAEKAIRKIANDPLDNAGVGKKCAEWAKIYHSTQRVLDIQLGQYRGDFEGHTLINSSVNKFFRAAGKN